MFPGAKIIAIDDDEGELRKIETTLRQLRLGCIAYNYPDPDLTVEADFRGVRLIFLDIQLVGGTSPGSGAVFSAPVSVLKRLVRDDNGPYALVTWSNNPQWHAELLQRLKDAPGMEKKQPFYAVSLDKNVYAADAGQLKEAVEAIFNSNPAFGALLDWERRVSAAGEKVLQLVEALSESFSGSSPSEKIDSLLSRLSADAFGKAHVKDHTFEAANEALLPLLTDALHSEFFLEDKSDLWRQAITKYDSAADIDADAVCKLNTAVIFEQFAGIKPYRRGAVLAVPLLSDEAFAERFGAKPGELRGSVLKIDEPKNLNWVLVQIQAACDFSQPKRGPLPFLLGAVIPAGYKLKTDKNGKVLSQPPSVWNSPELSSVESISNSKFHFAVLHGITYSLTRGIVDKENYKVLGRFKDQVTSAIAYEHHSHGSRPGYVNFRGG